MLVPYSRKKTAGAITPFNAYRKLKRYKNNRRSKRFNTVKNKMGITGPLSQKISTKLIYETGQIGVTTTTSPGTFTISLNDMFDPQYAIGGHQPRGYDEMSAIYGEYRVLAVKVNIYAQALSSGSHVIGYAIDGSTTPPGDINSYMEARNKKFKLGTLDRPTIISCYTSIAKALGVDYRRIRTDDNYRSGIGASPARIPYFHIFFQNNDESTSSGYNVRATITFYTEFSHPNILGQS